MEGFTIKVRDCRGPLTFNLDTGIIGRFLLECLRLMRGLKLRNITRGLKMNR